MDNHLYNLMLQLTQEQKSLWRIQNNYLADANEDKEAAALWQTIAAAKAEQVKMLEAHIQKRMAA
ncbi:MAG: hypothetical protein KC925_03980 [Candidatus Doudnabacteria bacterium]|nr:hypothetical protein [Candidatus Doudnabacteria bacterium]